MMRLGMGSDGATKLWAKMIGRLRTMRRKEGVVCLSRHLTEVSIKGERGIEEWGGWDGARKDKRG